MATEYDTTGVIIKTSKSSCVVSLTIDETPKSYSFSKTSFFSFGERCEGDMTNLLEDDMVVEVSYKIRPNGAVTILAVWLGEKPVLAEDDALSAIYDRRAVVRDVLSEDYVAESDDGRVLVDKRVLFRDGRRCSSIAEDEEICFDAIPFRDAHVSGAIYDATCAWTGAKPSIVDRFSLKAEESEGKFSDVVFGTVVVIPNETVALVDVEVDGRLTRVLLFRSSFPPGCDRIQDAVDLGDALYMRLDYGCVFPRRKQWFARVATKASDEDSLDLLRPENVMATCDSDTESTAAATCDIPAPIVTKTQTSKTDVSAPTITKTQTSKKDGPWYDKDCKFLYDDPPLSGTISKFSSYGHIKHGNLDILVDRSNFYTTGHKRAKREYFDSYVASGENVVNFEAVLMTREGAEFSRFSHEATCAWVTKKPALQAVAASLPPPDFKLRDEGDQVFYGIVSKLCFPSVALVEVPELCTTVCIHVHSFTAKPRQRKGLWLIVDFVKLGDCVEFKVEHVKMLPQLLCTREVKVEYSKKISDQVYAGTLSRKPGTNDKKSKPACETAPSKTTSQAAPRKSATKSSSSSPEPDVCIASPFKNGGLPQNRAFLMCCSGDISAVQNLATKSTVVYVEHEFGSSKVTDKTLYIRDGKSLSVGSIASLSGRKLRFDAETTMSRNSNSNFVVTRMWDLTDKRPPSEVVLYSDLKLLEGVSTRYCPAKITSIPLHDAAIATVRNVPVLVPFDSLVSLKEINYGCSSIDTVVSVGDFVGLRFERRTFPGELGGAYFRAVSCWALSKGGAEITCDDEIRPCAPRINSWFNKWGYGDFFCDGTFLGSGNKYLVRHKRRGSTQNLDIFEKGKVFVDGRLVEQSQLKSQKGRVVNYHVAHEHVDELSDDVASETFTPKGLFVACSWIGKKLSPEEMLRDKLAVPKGSICSNWLYELVVESFPLPTHAICRLGYAPVLVPLPEITQHKKFVGVKDVNLKRGDRILVRVLEDQVHDTTFLIANDTTLKKVGEIDYQDVLKNVSGKVETVPNPTGLIKANTAGFLVSFEFCHVRRSKKSSTSDSKWFESLKGQIRCGQKVYFSAVKVNGKTAPYRAFEVYFE